MRISVSMFVAALACLAHGCMRQDAAVAESAPEPKKTACVFVQSALLNDKIEVRGTVAPPLDREAQVAPQVAGRLLTVGVHEGDVVSAGQVIARVEDAPLVDTARQADAAVLRARAEHQNTQTTFARVQRVYDHGIVSKQELDDAAARDAASQAALVEAEAAANQAHRQTDRASVRSPLAGVVLKVLRKPGELVDGTPATPVADVADVSVLELVADVPAQDLVRLSAQAPAEITFPALPDRAFSGVVSRVAPAVDRITGVGSVRVALAFDAHARPPVGAFGMAQVDSGEPHATLLVPRAAVRALSESGAEVVECGHDRRAHVRKVRVGVARGSSVAVYGDLAQNTRVAVDPVLGLEDNDALEVAP